MKGKRRGVIWCIAFLFILYLGWRFLQYEESEEIIEMSEAEKMEYWKSSPLWVEDQRPHINPHRFGMLINNARICTENDGIDGGGKVDLLMMVTSAVKHVDRRNAIRQTWGNVDLMRRYNAKLIFLLGQGRDQQSQIQSENQLYRDIIQEDFEDSYHNLTLKTVMGLKWMSIFCPHAKFILKTDDDIYVNVPLLTSTAALESNFYNNIHGCIKNSPLNSPLPIPQEGFPEISLMKPALPQFTAGAGYLIPGRFASQLYMASLETKLIPVEDAYTTGFCAKKIGLHPPTNDRRFSCGQLLDNDCDMSRKFTGHKVTPERMYSIHESLMNNLCGQSGSSVGTNHPL